MDQPVRIRTSLRQHWRRLRYQLLPVLAFWAALPCIGWLWRQQQSLPNVTGEVQAVRVSVRSQHAGVLSELESGPLALFDAVRQGQVVARLDDAGSQAALAALQAETERLECQLAAETARIRQDEALRLYDRLSESRRLAVDLEAARLRILSLQTQLQTDKVALARIENLLESSEKLLSSGAATSFEVQDLQLRRDETQKRIDGTGQELAQAELDAKAAQARLAAQPATQPAEVQAFLEPIRKARAAQEARCRELELQIAGATIRAPVSGRVCSIVCGPGQAVRPGDEIVIIAADTGREVLAYVRERGGVQPKEGMTVLVRPRYGQVAPVQASVVRVGPAVEQMPAHQRLDPNRAEWGLPVLISLPEGANLLPGQLVDIALGG